MTVVDLATKRATLRAALRPVAPTACPHMWVADPAGVWPATYRCARCPATTPDPRLPDALVAYTVACAREISAAQEGT